MTRLSTLGGAALALALAAGGWAGTQETATPHEMHRRHENPQAYMAVLDNPERDEYSKPAEVVKALALREGEAVADIGSGTGYFTLRFARAVGETGTVYAVDVSPEMMRHLNRRLRDEGIGNVRAILAEPDDPLLRDDSVDRFVVVNTWHHIEDQAGYLEKMKRMLRPGGQVVHIDFHKKETPVGPPVAHKIAREDLVGQMEAEGFRLAAEHDFLPYQYFLVFEVPGS